MSSKPQSNLGFTMIELLIVIGIMSVLSVFAIMSLTGNRGKARDIKRKSDLRNIQKALELYKQCHNPPSYPASLPAVNAAWIEAGGGSATCTAGTTYMPFTPGDPSTNAAYDFTPSGLTYTLCTCLETSNDADPAVSSGNCSAGPSCSSGKRYQIIEQ